MARKEKKYHFIYKTTNLLSGKYYIGMHSTDNLDDGYLGSGRRLRYSINKYGKESHKREIIEFVNSRIGLIEREKEIINLDELAKDECMNLMVGGKGGFISEEQQKHHSKCANNLLNSKLENDQEFRKTFRENISNGLKRVYANGTLNPHGGGWNRDKTLTEDHKKNIGKTNALKQLGEKNSQFGTCWITKGDITKKIKKEEIEIHVNDGWIKGRCV